MSGRSLPPGECLQTGIALRAALVLAGLAARELVELVEQLAQVFLVTTVSPPPRLTAARGLVSRYLRLSR